MYRTYWGGGRIRSCCMTPDLIYDNYTRKEGELLAKIINEMKINQGKSNPLVLSGAQYRFLHSSTSAINQGKGTRVCQKCFGQKRAARFPHPRWTDKPPKKTVWPGGRERERMNAEEEERCMRL